MYDLTDAQINSFYQKGWLGPLDTFSAQEVESVRKELEVISKIEVLGEQKVRTFNNPHFGVNTKFNHHLWCKSLANLFGDERIIHRLNQLGEENLLLWRSSIFHRVPGQEGLGWHQAINYYGIDMDETKTALVFPEGEKPLNLTVWIAFVDVNPEMGLPHFANGSHKKKFKGIKVPLGQGAYPDKNYYGLETTPQDQRYSKSFDFNENEWEVETPAPIKSGQILIFTENVMHKAPPNCSTEDRWVINARYIRPSVTIYPQRLSNNYMDDLNYLDEFNLDTRKHFCILVSGSDNHKINNVVTRT